jgi:hypothetical protein
MAKKRSQSSPAASNETLAKLWQIYNKQQLRRNVLGRRAAMPSEIAAQIRNNRSDTKIAVSRHKPD